MTYSKQTWTDGAGGGTPLSAARLTHMEDGIEEVQNDVDTHGHPYVAGSVRLTVASSAPGSPNTNDLWVDTT